MSLDKTISATIDRYGMLARGRRVGVAVSGGADSVFLLRALDELGLAVAVLHINHKLRGEDSERDEAFVVELGRVSGLPVHIAEGPVTQGNIEQEARRARYAFFQEVIRSGFCDSVATGHTLDDQAETVLSRFMRGAGTTGLSGIRPATKEGIIRPLLTLGREEIRAWLREHGLEWREDCTNEQTEFQRNRLRLELMPQLATFNPSLAITLASTAEWARGEEEFWDEQIARLEPQIFQIGPETVLFPTESLNAEPVATQRRLIRRAVELTRGSLRAIDFRHIEAIRILTQSREGSGRIQLPDLDVYRSFDWMRLAPAGFDSRVPRDFEAPLTVPGITSVPERQLTIQIEAVTPEPINPERMSPSVYNSYMDVVDRERCEGLLAVRNWRPGDSYVPAASASGSDLPGSSGQDRDDRGKKKIKTLFQENRIPLWERRHWPVIVRGTSIVWARQFGVADEFAASPKSRVLLSIREIECNSQTRESNRTLRTSSQTGGSFERAESLQAGFPQGRRKTAGDSYAQRPGGPGAEVL